MLYPVFLNLQGKRVLVVGAGAVALRKVTGLLECGAVVTVVSPETTPGFDGLAVKMLQRRFRAGDVKGFALVFAATNERKTNRRIAQAAEKQGIPVNVADAPEECTFQVPARVRRGDLQVAVSTSGRNPRIAGALRKQIEQLLEEQNVRGLER